MSLRDNTWRRVTPISTALTPEQITAAENFDDGYIAGWNAAAPTHAQRDELIARRIVALLLQHQANHELAAWVTTLKPYTERGIPRRTA